MDSNTDRGGWSTIINSKAVSYLVLTLCVMAAAKFTLNIVREAGIIPYKKVDKPS